MIIKVTAKPHASIGVLSFMGKNYACALGRSGIVSGADKKEGDGATPAGTWALRRLLYRGDKMQKPATRLQADPISKSDGWCDAPSDVGYNTQIELPYGASTEALWRDDDLYNLITVLGHNDDPVKPEEGSAIFFHVAKFKNKELAATEGCVALPEATLKIVLESCSSETVMEISLEA